MQSNEGRVPREEHPLRADHGDLQHGHENGFQHLVPLEGLERNYDLGWKFETNTDGPPGWKGDPYLLLYISFATISGTPPRSGTLHYALTRSRWHDVTQVSDDDRERLTELAKERVRVDLAALEQGNEPLWLDAGKHLYLIPPRT